MATTSSIDSIDINPEQETPFMQLIKLLLRRWWIFALIGLIAGIAGYIYASFQQPKYESRLTFSLDGGSGGSALSGAMSLAAQFGFGIGSGQNMFEGDNILEIMKSRKMLEEVLLTVDTFEGKPYTLVQYFIEKNGLKAILNTKERLKNINFPVGTKKKSLSYLQDSILYNVYLGFAGENIVASRPDKKLSIYEVKIISTNEKFSKIFTDRIVASTGNFYTEITSKKDRETLEILEQRVASLKSNVSSSIDVKASNQDANVNPAFASVQTTVIKEQYNAQAYGEAYKEMFKTLEMARYQYLKKIPLLQIIDNADYPMKKIKSSKIKSGLIFSTFSVLLAILGMWALSLFDKKYFA